MNRFLVVLSFLVLFGCVSKEEIKPILGVKVKPLFANDSLSFRAIDILDGSLAFAGNKSVFGTVSLDTDKVRVNFQKYNGQELAFRSIGHTATDFFMLSVGNPALLYKTGDSGQMELVYKEEGEGVFYDSLQFWNDQEGIAIGDSVNGCLSIIITRDGGKSWQKIACENLPKGKIGEGAFAASNTNIAVFGNMAWIATTAGRVYKTIDKGQNWEVTQTPVLNKKDTEGIYSIAFLNDKEGVVIGGDYQKPEGNTANKAITKDGGKTWQLVADGSLPNYKSCVQYVPDTDGKQIVSLGFNGIVFSNNGGDSWQKISDESFYTIRFLNDSIAYAAGKGRIAKLHFKR